MCSLNYRDLQYLIIEYEIEDIKHLMREKARLKNERNGVEVIQATNDQILSMHKRS